MVTERLMAYCWAVATALASRVTACLRTIIRLSLATRHLLSVPLFWRSLCPLARKPRRGTRRGISRTLPSKVNSMGWLLALMRPGEVRGQDPWLLPRLFLIPTVRQREFAIPKR